MDQKRVRSINWDEEEKQLFRTVLKEYAHIIENKSLDTNSNKRKVKAWDDVHKKFNELNGRNRQLSQLKIQWKAMKINARKTYSKYKNESNKTGGGARPTTPDDEVIEVKDLLNPAELFRDHNIYDSDGINPTASVNNVILATTSETCAITSQDAVPMTCDVLTLNTCSSDNVDQDNPQITNMCLERVGDVDAQVDVPELIPLVISQDNPLMLTPKNKNMATIPAKITQGSTIAATPTKIMSITSNKKVPKRKIMLNQIPDKGLKSRKDHEDYLNSIIIHSKMLKDKEHMRHMEMLEEEHSIKMDIHKEKLRCAILESEILELKLKTEQKKINQMFGDS